MKFLLVHHSASRNGHSTADAPGILRSFYDYHTGPEKGWNDIAYNFLIDAGGGIWEGRSGSFDGPVAGDATGGNQGFTQLVCLIGDYNVAQPSIASLSSPVPWPGVIDECRISNPLSLSHARHLTIGCSSTPVARRVTERRTQ